VSARLEVLGATRRFGGLVAVDGVSFAVAPGEVVGLLGPNGSGKTTLLNLISGALRPTSGSILLDGVEIGRARPDRIARHGLARTFQLVRILPSLTLMENVMVPAAFGPQRLWGEPARAAALESLAMVGLEGRAGAAAGELTYIDQKRLELARALGGRPRILLLDEWLAGLNPTELQEGIALVRRLAASGLTVVMVEHIMEAVRALCPRCLVMHSGRLIADGPTAEVLARPEVIEACLGAADA
jgi:branched-chain amino acid transport system ATP-binding protein